MKPITIYACPLYMPTPFPAFIIIQHIRMKPLNKSLLHLNQVQCKTLHYCMQLQVHAFLMNYTSSEVLTDLKERLHYSTIADNTCFSAFVILLVLQFFTALHEFQNSFYKFYKCPRRCNLLAVFDFQTVQTL